jgi:hypothetical protein
MIIKGKKECAKGGQVAFSVHVGLGLWERGETQSKNSAWPFLHSNEFVIPTPKPQARIPPPPPPLVPGRGTHSLKEVLRREKQGLKIYPVDGF